MWGAIIGDINGSKYEFENTNDKNFKMFQNDMYITDDSVMTVAVAEALLSSKDDYSDLREKTIDCMKQYGKRYPGKGYGGSFQRWLTSGSREPYNSWGNGAAMRVSAVGEIARNLEEVKKLSKMVTEVTHNHRKGIIGAEAVASSIYFAKCGSDKAFIKKYAIDNYYEELKDLKVEDFAGKMKFDESCQGTVPYAIEIFYESKNFEDAIRTAVSVGGDSDTIAAIVGSIAEAYYGIPEEFIREAKTYVPARFELIIRGVEKRKAEE